MSTAQKAQVANRFKLDKATSGSIMQLTLHGVLDENFEGKKLAEGLRANKVVMNLQDVRRFASWGMSEWMNFMRGKPDADVYLVECSTYAVNQFTLVTGLTGHAKLVSFYSPFRCGSCEEEFDSLILTPTDRDQIDQIVEAEQPCPRCGGTARMEQHPAQLCRTMLQRPAFDIDDEVIAFLRAKYKYNLTPDVARFRAYRQVNKDTTYLRLAGNVARLPSDALARATSGTTILDLADIVFTPGDLISWRAYVQQAMGKATSLQLLDCPPGFLEAGVETSDLEQKLKVRTFALSYPCPSCNTMTTGIVDVAPNLEQLTEGVVPSARCPTCTAVLVATTTPGEAMLLRHLPAREHDEAVDAFLAKARQEPPEKLEDALTVRPTKDTGAQRGSRVLVLASVLSVLLLAGLGAVAYMMWRQSKEKPAATTAVATTPTKPGPTFTRPEWITSDLPASAFCQDMINRVMCFGVSSYRADKEAAVAEANDAALEEMVNTIGLKVTDGFFKENELPGYTDARGKLLSALQAADVDRKSTAYVNALEPVRAARKRVAAALRASGGPTVPAQRSDWYWEEYAPEKGGTTEFLVFVRYDLTVDTMRSLVERFSVPTPVGESAAVTAFPSLGWQYADFAGGAMLTKVEGPLAGAKLAPKAIVTAAGETPVTDAATFAKLFDDAMHGAGVLKLTARTGDAPAQVVEVRR